MFPAQYYYCKTHSLVECQNMTDRGMSMIFIFVIILIVIVLVNYLINFYRRRHK
jgi:hypothetical protein